MSGSAFKGFADGLMGGIQTVNTFAKAKDKREERAAAEPATPEIAPPVAGTPPAQGSGDIVSDTWESLRKMLGDSPLKATPAGGIIQSGMKNSIAGKLMSGGIGGTIIGKLGGKNLAGGLLGGIGK